MNRAGRLLASAVATAVVSGLVAGAPTGAATAPSVRALVTRGPVTPVCREGTPCDEPAEAVAFVVRSARNVVARPVTDSRGRFVLRLAPGTYVVSLARPAAIGGLRSKRFVVRRGQVTTLRLQIDTGIR